jgi:hypothetical protein
VVVVLLELLCQLLDLPTLRGVMPGRVVDGTTLVPALIIVGLLRPLTATVSGLATSVSSGDDGGSRSL